MVSQVQRSLYVLLMKDAVYKYKEHAHPFIMGGSPQDADLETKSADMAIKFIIQVKDKHLAYFNLLLTLIFPLVFFFSSSPLNHTSLTQSHPTTLSTFFFKFTHSVPLCAPPGLSLSCVSPFR